MHYLTSVSLLLLLSLVALAASTKPHITSSLKYVDGTGIWELFGRPDGHERSRLVSELRLHKDWWQYKQKFGRTFSSYKEEVDRKSVFAANMQFIRQHNELADQGLKTYRLGLTQYTDMTHEEFLAKMTGIRRHESQIRRGSIAYISPATEPTLPTTVDWRTKGAVTPVKDQGQCGSCWSFSTTGSLEGQHFRKTGRLLSLSEQQLVDCAGGRYGNQGCNGGLMDNAFQYVRDFGIELESDYPYTAREGTCRFSKSKVVANCTGFVDIPRGSEAKLKEAVANAGPVSVAIDASNPSFQHYRTGVYNEPSCSSTQLDHGVLVVGYGTLGGMDYWLVKNSWNVQWGVQGYIRMARNKRNQCGIATSASYPTV